MLLIRSIASRYMAGEQRDHGALRCIWQLCICRYCIPKCRIRV